LRGGEKVTERVIKRRRKREGHGERGSDSERGTQIRTQTLSGREKVTGGRGADLGVLG